MTTVNNPDPDPTMASKLLAQIALQPGSSFDDLCAHVGVEPVPEGEIIPPDSPVREVSHTLRSLWDGKLVYPVTTTENLRGAWFPGVQPA